MNLRTVVIGAGFAGGLALGYWFGTHRAQPRLAPPDSATIAGSPAISTNPSVPTQMSAAATKIVEEARAQHFEELHNVQDVFTLPSAFARREALYALGGRADARELAALITEANNLPNPADRAAALDVLYLRYVERDAQTALQSALNVQEPQARSEALTRVGTAWGSISPEAAFQRAELEPDPAVRAILQGAILRTWALQNPEEAFSHVMCVPPRRAESGSPPGGGGIHLGGRPLCRIAPPGCSGKTRAQGGTLHSVTAAAGWPCRSRWIRYSPLAMMTAAPASIWLFGG